MSFQDMDAVVSEKLAKGSGRGVDERISWALFFVAFVVRFYRLGIPGGVVFDEFHFGTFVDNLLRREVLFDIHPPLGKLTLAFFGWLLGYRPVDGFDYDEIGKDYGSVLYYPLREVAAIFGTATVPLVYATSRELGVSWVGSLAAAVLYCFDNLNIIESRLILMDSQIMFYLVLSLYCALRLWKTEPSSWARFQWLTLTGLVCGLSISIKWTALATPAMIAIVSFFGLHFLPEPLTLAECMWAGFSGLSLYVLFFFVQMKVLVKSGPGLPFFSDEMKKTFAGAADYDPHAKRPHFFRLLWEMNKTMLISNANITTRHNWESYWYQWIVNWRGLLYYNKEEQSTHRWMSVYLMCNPIVCWLCAGCVGIMLVVLMFCVRYREISFTCSIKSTERLKTLSTCMFLLSGWLVNLLPYILVDRSAFVYHYLPGLLYAQLLSGVMVDQLPRFSRLATLVAFTAVTVAAFVYFAPWIYCFPISSDQHAERRWFGRWD